MISKPVFLFGVERSGTNLLRAIMDAHPRFAAPTSPHLLMTFLPILQHYGFLVERNNLERLAEDVVTTLQNQLGSWASDICAEHIVQSCADGDFMSVFDFVYSAEREARGAARVFFKENEACFHAELLLRHYPDAQFVYLVRDGRDVVLSHQRSMSHFGSINEGASLWRDEQRACLALYCDPGFRPRMLPVHYEDLVTAPRDTVTRICEFVGETFEEQMLDFYEQPLAMDAAASVQNWENLSRPVMRENHDKYKRAMDSRTIARIEAIIHRELFQTGYDLHTSPANDSKGRLGRLVKNGWQYARKMFVAKRTLDITELRMRADRVEIVAEISSRRDHRLPRLLPRAGASILERVEPPYISDAADR